MDPDIVPIDWPVQPLKANDHAKDRATCGHCGLSWDDGVSTSLTPTPSARCPFEPFHVYEENPPDDWEDCDCCDGCHPPGYSGDCRDDQYRWPSKITTGEVSHGS